MSYLSQSMKLFVNYVELKFELCQKFWLRIKDLTFNQFFIKTSHWLNEYLLNRIYELKLTIIYKTRNDKLKYFTSNLLQHTQIQSFSITKYQKSLKNCFKVTKNLIILKKSQF